MTRFTEQRLTKQCCMEGHSHFVKTMKQSEFIKHNISSKNNLYVEAKEVGVEIYCF